MDPLIPGEYYHIYNHANGDDNLFREWENFRFFTEKLHLYVPPVADICAWCLMPNHFHLLAKIKSEKELESTFPKFKTLEMLNDQSKFIAKRFSNLFSCYTQAFNKKYDRRGSLFLKNFKRKMICNRTQFIKTFVYIHNNPVKHGFTKKLSAWEWSSYQGYLNISEDNTSFQKVLDYLGGIDTFISLHQMTET